MGVVYKARQEDLDRVVAVKMILASHLASADQVRRFQAEARAAAKLRHSHIVPIHEVGQLNGQDFFTMDYIEGQSLAQYIEEKKGQVQLCDDQRWRSVPAFGPFRQMTCPLSRPCDRSAVARAVEYLHAQGIVHRDLKPSNILLDAQGEPYLTDFGLAKMLEPETQLTATGVIAGTPAYMAPEQAAGRGKEVGPASDIYSLGAILYELLTGQPPFLDENPLDTLSERLERRSDVAAAIKSEDPRESGANLPDVPAKNAGRSDILRPRPWPTIWSVLPGASRLKFARRIWGSGFWAGRGGNRRLASRLGGLAIFYVIAWVNYLIGFIDADYHIKISVVLACWVMESVICQRLVESRRVHGFAIHLGHVGLDSFPDRALDRRRSGQRDDRGLFAVDSGLGLVVPRAIRIVHGRFIAYIVRRVDIGLLLCLASLAGPEVECALSYVRPACDIRGIAVDYRLDRGILGRAGADSEQLLWAKEIRQMQSAECRTAN